MFLFTWSSRVQSRGCPLTLPHIAVWPWSGCPLIRLSLSSFSSDICKTLPHAHWGPFQLSSNLSTIYMNRRKMGTCTAKADIMSRGVHIKWELREWEQSESASSVQWKAIYCTATSIFLMAFVSWKTYTTFKKQNKQAKTRSSVCSEYHKEHTTLEKIKDGHVKSPLPGREFSWVSANQGHSILLIQKLEMPNALFTSW